MKNKLYQLWEQLKGYDYSKTRVNEYDEIEYYIDDYDEWMTEEDAQEQRDEEGYWNEQVEEWADD